jgi:hypothetical protein
MWWVSSLTKQLLHTVHIAPKYTYCIERVGICNDAPSAQHAVARLEPNNACIGSGQPHGATSIRPKCAVSISIQSEPALGIYSRPALIRRNRHGTSTRTTSCTSHVPVAHTHFCFAKTRMYGMRSHPEFIHVCLPSDNCAGIA